MRFPVVAILLLAIPAVRAADTTPLFEAIQRSDTAGIKRALDRGVPATATDADGLPAIMSAALFADTAAMKLLLDRGADPNAALPNGATALMWSMPDIEKARLLILRGANVDARSTNLGRTAFLIAASYPSSAALLQFLIEKGADIKARDRSGETALNWAVRSGDIDSVRLLAERGLDVNDPGAGVPPLGRALVRQYRPTVDYLISKGAKMRAVDLAPAIHWLPPNAIEPLIPLAGEVNGRAGNGRTAIIYAASSDITPIETLKLLLAKGADPNLADADGETALDWAVHRADAEKIALLKQHGAKEGSTPRDQTFGKPEGAGDLRASLTRAIALLQPAGPPVFARRACPSCHNQTMVAQAAAFARDRGVKIDEQLAAKNLKQILAVYRPVGQEAMQGQQPGGGEVGIGYGLMALAAERHPADKTTAGFVHVTASRQMPDGSWPEVTSRPPLESSNISRTVLAMRALTLYPIEGRRKEMERKVALTRSWLLAARPRTAEDYAMRIAGLGWSKASRAELDAAASEWIAQQRPDGGWAQLPHLESDAYGTGITLFALHEAGIPTVHAAYKKGIAWLLRNQYEDGSWFVKTRAFPVQPQFESGYPFGYNQWISAAGASWSAMAMSFTLPEVKSSAKR